MFMICSGGGWWYRFCRQNETSTTYPSIPQPISTHFTPQNTRDLHRRNSAEHQSRRSRASHSYSRSRNRDHFYLSHMWKGPSNQFPPSYFSSNQYTHHQSGQQPPPFHQECPYHILYGPPPSYDSVIQISDTSRNSQPICTLVNSTSTGFVPTSPSNELNLNISNEHNLDVIPSTSDAKDLNDEIFQNDNDSIKMKNITNSLSTSEIERQNHINETQFSTIPSTSKGKKKYDKSKIVSV